ncbi:aminoalkylphosphonic acid N-acetyltransferase [compost metagenome]
MVGTFQATLLTSLPGRGRPRLLIEAVQTRKDMRGRGIGARMIRHAIERAREEGAAKVQLSSNATRTDAHRFYERLGFVRSHFGFHMPLK